MSDISIKCRNEFQSIVWDDLGNDEKAKLLLQKLEHIQKNYPKEEVDKYPIINVNIKKLRKRFSIVQTTTVNVEKIPEITKQPSVQDDIQPVLTTETKQCGLNLYNSNCEENISIGNNLCVYKNKKCIPIPESDISIERNILIQSVIDNIEKITDQELLSLILINLPETQLNYEKYILNNEKIELEFKIAIISELIIRLQTEQINSRDFKYSLNYLQLLEKQLNNKLNEGIKFKLIPLDETTVFKKSSTHSTGISLLSQPPRSSLIVSSSAGPAGPVGKIQLLHDRNRKMSCYVNSSLYALFHKHNNPFIQMIKNAVITENIVLITSKNQSCNNLHLKNLIIQYYQNIHREIQMPFPTDNIRHFLADCTYSSIDPPTKYSSGYWTHEQQDNNEFIRQIIQKFNFKETNNKFQLLEETFYTKPFIPNTKDTLDTKRINVDDEIPIYNWPVTYTDTLDIEVNIEEIPNAFRIKGVEEELTMSNYAHFEDKDGNPLIYQQRQINNVYINPNMLIIFINRTIGTWNERIKRFESGKTEAPVNIPFQIYNLYLYSIVIHIGHSVNTGHYTCYFKNEDNWYLMDDLKSTIEQVDITNPSIINNISKNCTTLVYYPL